MTEKPRLSPTQSAIPSQNPVAPTVHAPAPPPPPQPDAPRKLEATEEEPYTIKCICNFSDDDGNTIYCETCDTWQHIDCFYPHSQEEALREDFAHSCAECKPRQLDIQRAIERTKRLKAPTVPEEASDKKTKRPPSKNAKKKSKPGELQLNGLTGPEATKFQVDGPTPTTSKKSKHKPSHSVSSQPNKRSPSLGHGKVNGHPPSPATTPPELPMPENFTFHGYSDSFLSLYDNEPEHDPKKAPSNSYSSLAASNSISLWPHNRQKMVEETGEQFDDVVQKMPAGMSERAKSLNVREKKATFNGIVHRWKYLEAPAPFEKDQPLIELYGLVGFQKDYCADPDNMWEELSAPLPFVFFHGLLPLCIDTRTSTSPARYVRQSCKPNAVLETFISDDRELHYWLVSDRSIAKNEQITLPWDFRLPASQKARMLRLMGLGDEDTNLPGDSEMDETEYQTLSGWMDRLLSEYGGCACGSGIKCAFYRFHQNYLNRNARRLQPPKKKSRKQKNSAISPIGSVPVVASREVSENHVDDADNEGRSASERSKPPSRDRTPGARAASLDQPEILTELTDREKRKVQMVEDSFRRMEQQPPPRKKKRTSDGTNPKTKSKSSSTNTGTAGSNRYVDAGTTFRSKSGSPASAHSVNGSNSVKGPASVHSPRSVSSAPRLAYCDASVQTDPVPDQWYSDVGRMPKPRRRVISLSQRLLNNRHKVRCDSEQKKQHVASPVSQASPPIAMDVDPPAEAQPDVATSPTVSSRTADVNGSPVSPAVPESSTDTAMPDATAASPTQVKQATAEPSVPTIKTESEPEKTKSPELRVQLPPVPTFGGNITGTPNTTTPQSASGTMLQSPFAPSSLTSPLALGSVNGVAPSPVKKKLSLSDYTKSRANKKSSVGPKTPGAAGEENKPSLDSIADAPNHEKSEEAAMPAQTNGMSSVATN